MLNKKKKNKLDVIVKELMIHHTEMRDNYDMLYGAVVTRYFEERGGKTYLQSITAWDYLCLMVRRETPNYRSVVRAWAKIQEKFPHLTFIFFSICFLITFLSLIISSPLIN